MPGDQLSSLFEFPWIFQSLQEVKLRPQYIPHCSSSVLQNDPGTYTGIFKLYRYEIKTVSFHTHFCSSYIP
jgi:hypothetical protein